MDAGLRSQAVRLNIAQGHLAAAAAAAAAAATAATAAAATATAALSTTTATDTNGGARPVGHALSERAVRRRRRR